MPKQTLLLLDGQFSVHSFAPEKTVPEDVLQSDIYFLGKTHDELSIVCRSTLLLDSEEQEDGWRSLEVLGPLGFSLTGILSDISGVLASADISIFAISTFDTDYILIKEENVDSAVIHLEKAGYNLRAESN